MPSHDNTFSHKAYEAKKKMKKILTTTSVNRYLNQKLLVEHNIVVPAIPIKLFALYIQTAQQQQHLGLVSGRLYRRSTKAKGEKIGGRSSLILDDEMKKEKNKKKKTGH